MYGNDIKPSNTFTHSHIRINIPASLSRLCMFLHYQLDMCLFFLISSLYKENKRKT